MAQNRKQEIMTCARKLFEARGYNGVSMRDIASQLGISVGNLTYHFKKKEDLLEALLLDSTSTRRKQPTPETLEELWGYVRHLLEVQQTYAFYFDSYHQLSQTSPVLAQVQKNMLAEITAVLRETFTHLLIGGILTPEGYPGQHQTAVHTFTLLLMVRLPGEERRTTGETGIQALLESLRGFLFPLLTVRGKADLNRFFPEKKD